MCNPNYGQVKDFLRMNIVRKNGNIYLDQCQYLDTVIQRCGMQNAKPAPTPLPAGYQPVPNDKKVNPELRQRFQVIIGSLLYIMLGTRPDICYAVTKLSQHAANPSQEHLNRALYVCRYLIGTKNYALVYRGKPGMGVSACVDSDWASNPTDRKSTTGYFVKSASAPVIWVSRAQKTVALSSTEAEYMALSDCSRQVTWIHQLLGEIGYTLGPIPICGDNQGAIFISANPVTEKRSKHIDIRYHYIREVIERRLVEVFYIDGAENPADMLTKNLGHVKFLKFRSQYGMVFYQKP